MAVIFCEKVSAREALNQLKIELVTIEKFEEEAASTGKALSDIVVDNLDKEMVAKFTAMVSGAGYVLNYRDILDYVGNDYKPQMNKLMFVKVEYNKQTFFLVTSDNISVVEATIVDLYNVVPKFIFATSNLVQKVITHKFDKNITDSTLLESSLEDTSQTSVTELDISTGMEDEGGVKAIINNILKVAVNTNVSDIHFILEGSEYVMAFRVGSHLVKKQRYSRAVFDRLCNRLIVEAGNHVHSNGKTEPFRDFSIRMQYEGKYWNLRGNTMRIGAGGNAQVLDLRINDSRMLDLSKLHLSKGIENTLLKNIKATQGLIIATGPTGSGKTALLSALIGLIRDDNRLVVSIEDPIEVPIDGVIQLEVSEKNGITYDSAFKEFLRHDPDVLMMSEVRDEPAAKNIIRASNTGHLALSTVHTNDSVSAVDRLLDLGVNQSILASELRLVVSQRLIDMPCPKCSHLVNASPEDTELLHKIYQSDSIPEQYLKGTGKVDGEVCDLCNGLGVYGRVPVDEILVATSAFKRAVYLNKSLTELREVAKEDGYISLLDDAKQRFLSRKISFEGLKELYGNTVFEY